MPQPTRIVLPASAKKGEVFQIKTIIQHEMESGFRRNDRGLAIARHIITSFVVTYAGAEIFRADVFPGVAANPYFAFTTTATETGEVVFTWTDDRGDVTTERRMLTVT
jgi:sulfur-oxidizing protein SoxZ